MVLSPLNFAISSEFYLKDPNSTDLGKKILSEGLKLMNDIGLEEFTFKKLSIIIGTTESTMYRYFENKNQLLFYYFNYYWYWMEYELAFAITNIQDPKEKLKRAIQLITKTVEQDSRTPQINENFLQNVIMLESSKTFLSKKVDEENNLGYFKSYKKFVNNMSEILLEINPVYPYSHALISTVIESAFHQRFFSIHLPKLSDDISTDEKLNDFFFQMTIHSIENYHIHGKN